MFHRQAAKPACGAPCGYSRSLRSLGLAAGFRRIEFHVVLKGRAIPLPFAVGAALEWGLDRIPRSWRGRAARLRLLQVLMGVNAIMHR